MIFVPQSKRWAIVALPKPCARRCAIETTAIRSGDETAAPAPPQASTDPRPLSKMLCVFSVHASAFFIDS
jgi:hypothetical protein